MIFTYNSPKIPFILLKTKLSPVTCHHMDNITIPLKYFGYNSFAIFLRFSQKCSFCPRKCSFLYLRFGSFNFFS